METIVVGLSGGVDSSVAALLLKQQGYNVIGVFMKNWEEKDDAGACCSEADSRDAQAVAEKIGIPFYTVNFAKEYESQVFKEFLADLKAGITPNPDVLCNRKIKFGYLLDYAKKLGAAKLATGHYCDVEYVEGVWQLKQCADAAKDQTYFLCDLTQEQLKYAMFPLARLNKTQVREIAAQNDFVTAQKKDSTGICFIGERNFKKFLEPYLKDEKGKIVTVDGEAIGEHDGLCYYTLGQKKGLNIGGIKGFEGASFCVVAKDKKRNELVVAPDGSPQTLSRMLTAPNFNFTGQKYKGAHRLAARFRHRQALVNVVAVFKAGGVTAMFDKPQRAVTPGQYVVLYDGENVVGGGKIKDVKTN